MRKANSPLQLFNSLVLQKTTLCRTAGLFPQIKLVRMVIKKDHLGQQSYYFRRDEKRPLKNHRDRLCGSFKIKVALGECSLWAIRLDLGSLQIQEKEGPLLRLW